MLTQKTFEDYRAAGPLAAVDAIKQATGEDKVKALGYGIGGTLLSCTMAYLAAGKKKPIASATYLT
jgi:polyhydroxyalkanoate synthase